MADILDSDNLIIETLADYEDITKKFFKSIHHDFGS